MTGYTGIRKEKRNIRLT